MAKSGNNGHKPPPAKRPLHVSIENFLTTGPGRSTNPWKHVYDAAYSLVYNDWPDPFDRIRAMNVKFPTVYDYETICTVFDEAKKKAIADIAAQNGHAEPAIVQLSDVELKPVRWTWPGKIPRDMYSSVFGDGGLGKTLIMMDMAARISSGMPFPDGSPCECGDVVLLSFEDDLSRTIAPRIAAAGGDLSRIAALQGAKAGDGNIIPMTLHDVDLIRKALDTRKNPLAIIIDPVTGACGKTDANSNAEVRAVLTPLINLAEEYGVAIVGISHSKKGDASALHKMIGSVAWAAAARAAWMVLADPQDETNRRRLMLNVKMNVAEPADGLAFTIMEDQTCTAVVSWEQKAVTVSADDVMATQRDKKNAKAVAWLKDFLAYGGRPAKEVYDEGKNAGFTQKQLLGALDALDGSSERSEYQGQYRWVIPLNGARTQHYPDCQTH